jgi:hypothetical protein
MSSFDGIVRKKRILVDWQALKAEFIINAEYTKVATWFKEVKGWEDNRVNNGGFFTHTENWGSERVAFRERILSKRIKRAQENIQTLKPDIIQAKMDIIIEYLRLLKEGHFHRELVSNWEEVGTGKTKKMKETKELKEWYTPLTMRDRSHILSKLKTELGEPAIITKVNTEDVTPFDPIAYLMEAYGITSNGKLRLDESVRPHPVIEG